MARKHGATSTISMAYMCVLPGVYTTLKFEKICDTVYSTKHKPRKITMDGNRFRIIGACLHCQYRHKHTHSRNTRHRMYDEADHSHTSVLLLVLGMVGWLLLYQLEQGTRYVRYEY